MICPNCGQEANGNFCSSCGAALSAVAPAASPPPASEYWTRTPAPVPAAGAAAAAPTASPAAAASVPAAPPPAPASHPSTAARCPLCREADLQPTEVRAALGLAHHPALVCPRCGATLVQAKGDAARYELAATRQPELPAWHTYAHQTLGAAEWQRIAAGGVSDGEQAESDLAAAMTELRQGRVTLNPSAACPVLLKGGEAALFVLGGISLHEPRAVTRGAYGGPSVHVAKGLTLRVGGFQAESHEEPRAIDSGTLTLTSKRLCFAGQLRSLEVDLRKVISIDAYSDAVAIRRSGKEKTEFFFGLDHSTYSFTVQDRSYSEPMSGLILKYAIEGLLNPAAG
jgi:hypothetical protein